MKRRYKHPAEHIRSRYARCMIKVVHMSSNQWRMKFLSWKTTHQYQTISTQDNVDLSSKMWLMNNIYDWVYFLSPAAIKRQCFCPCALCFDCVVQVPISIKAHLWCIGSESTFGLWKAIYVRSIVTTKNETDTGILHVQLHAGNIIAVCTNTLCIT